MIQNGGLHEHIKESILIFLELLWSKCFSLRSLKAITRKCFVFLNPFKSLLKQET